MHARVQDRVHEFLYPGDYPERHNIEHDEDEDGGGGGGGGGDDVINFLKIL